MEPVIVWLLVTLVGSFGGSYLGAYFKKKGENLATQEDIGKLVEQVQAVTKATKEIEAKISDEVWNRQRRWECKRDLILDGARRLGVCMEAFLALCSAYRADREELLKGQPGNIDERIRRAEVWNKASNEFSASTFLLVSLVCGKELEEILAKFGSVTRKIGIELTGGNPDAFLKRGEEFAVVMNALSAGLRKELAVGG
jgi:hypothetical protein